MKTIKILGGGIAGLTAAINLKKADYDVEVYEKKKYCGKHTNDFQYLENWTFDEDTIKFLRKINIKTNFYIKPWFSLELYSPTFKKYLGKSSKPLMYLIKRGQSKDSLDKSLENQAKKNKIKIIYNSKLKPNQADIIATGTKKPTWVAIGIKFKCKLSDKATVLLDNQLSSKAYSYFIVNNNIGEIVCCNKIGTKNINNRLKQTVKKFEKIFNFKVKNSKEKFASVVYFDCPDSAKVNNKYYIGEVIGFQDNLAGFGMVYAFKSGYYAAKSIIENKNYDKMWKKDFLKQLKSSNTNRFIFEKLSNNSFEKVIRVLNSNNIILKKLIGGKDLRKILKKTYNNSISYFLRPLIYLWLFN